MLDYQVQDPELLHAILEKHPESHPIAIIHQGASESFYHGLGIKELWPYHVAWPLRNKFKLINKVRERGFDTAAFVGRTIDLRQMAVIWASGAREKRFFQVMGKGTIREKKIHLRSFLGLALMRSILFIIFIPLLLFLRLSFKFGEWGYFVSHSPPDFDPLVKTAAPHPPVSVVIPNYNGREMLAEGLPSIIKAMKIYNPDSEIIVVDDASTDDSVSYLRKEFPELSIIPLDTNRGFGKACDAGIMRARHDLTLLLNSDIAVTDRFLVPLVKHFMNKEIFAVQPRAYGWDRETLNFGLNMGEMEQGYIHIYNEVDTGNEKYISQTAPTLYALGGAMLFDRRKYRDLGGFDPLFYPFRWEDIDLCYRALKRGWKILYEPDSVVFHKHHGTLEKVFQADYLNIIEQKNELLFIWKNIHDRQWILNHFQKLPRILLSHLVSGRYNFARALLRAVVQLPEAWKKRELAKRQCLQPDCQILEKSLRYYQKFVRRGFKHSQSTRKKVLLIYPAFPYPPIDGGKARIFNTIKQLSKLYDIDLLCYIQPDQKKFIPVIEKVCRQVDTIDYPPNYGYLGRKKEALFPGYYRYYYSDAMRDRVLKILAERDMDIVHLETDKTLFLINFISGYPTVFVDQDVAPLFLNGGKDSPQPGWRRIFDWIEWLKTIRWEVDLGRKAVKILALSPEDRRILKSILPEKDIVFVKHGTNTGYFHCPYVEVTDKILIFIGSYIHYPNRDAIRYFYRSIWPLVKKRHPDIRLKVVGSHPDEEIKALANVPGIEVLGFVDDVRPHAREAMVFIAPMRKGLGMKGKILEALVMAKPTVTTSIACHGAPLKQGEHLLIADTAEEFADSICRLIAEPDLRRKLACRGQEMVLKEYDWSHAAAQLDEIYRSIA